MAKTKAPLFSLDATGTLDKNITYKGKKQSNIAQKYSKPGAVNPFESSPRQKDQRSIIRLITIHWQCMSSADKLSWNSAAKDVRFKGTGYHYFLHMAQQNLTQYLGLVGYWSMNYNIDDNIPDLSGNGNHGILSPIYPCDSPTLVNSNNKKQGKALSFDPISSYLAIPTSPVTKNLTSKTMSVFIKIPVDPLGNLQFYNGNYWYATYGDLFGVKIPGNTFHYHLRNTAGVTCKQDITYIPNTYNHFVYSWDGTTVYYYKNGLPYLPEKLFSGTMAIDRPNVFLNYFNSPGLNAFIIDNFMIFNRSLGPKEILKIYNSYILP